jgi:hypothetical protein
MRAILKSFDSPDIPDLASYVPSAPCDFGFLLQMFVGPENSEGEELFTIVVCTPAWLLARIPDNEPMLINHHLLVRSYEYAQIHDWLSRLIAKCVGETWEAVALQISKIGSWEFAGLE